MDREALASYAEDVADALQSAPEMSARTAEVRITEPLLELLEWDLRGEDVAAGHPVGEETIGFALFQDDRPAVFVETRAPTTDLDGAAATDLASVMERAGVRRGILHNGRTFAFLRVGGDREIHRCSLGELPDRSDVLASYTREAVAERTGRADPGGALAADRADLVAEITARLLATTDGAVHEELADAATSFVDQLIEGFGATPPDEGVPAAAFEVGPDDAGAEGGATSGTTGESGSTESAADGGEMAIEKAAPAEARPDGTSTGDTGEAVDTADGTTPKDAGDDDPGAADPDAASLINDTTTTPDDADEFVIRFFDEGNSVGAVGTESSPKTLVQSIAFLGAQRSLLRGLSLPWGPREGPDDRALIAHEPVHPDGTEMSDHHQLNTGHYVYTDIPAAAVKAVLEELARNVGLQVMFQGEWDEE